MRKFLTTTVAALLLLTSAALPTRAQEDEGEKGNKKTFSGIPSRYIDCIQPLTIDILLSASPSQWGFGGDMFEATMDRLYGIQLCRAYVEETRQHCRQLANVPARGREKKMFEEMGYHCALDSALLQTQVAARSEGRIPFEPRCQELCELNQVRSAKKFDCADFCKVVKPLLPARVPDACKAYVERAAPLHKADPEYAEDAVVECRMRLDPSPATCTDPWGPLAKKSCLDHYAILEAARKKDPKLCPKSLRYAAVCAAVTAPEGKSGAEMCLAAARAFTVPYCDALKASGGLQDTTKLPGDPDSKAAW